MDIWKISSFFYFFLRFFLSFGPSLPFRNLKHWSCERSTFFFKPKRPKGKTKLLLDFDANILGENMSTNDYGHDQLYSIVIFKKKCCWNLNHPWYILIYILFSFQFLFNDLKTIDSKALAFEYLLKNRMAWISISKSYFRGLL